MIATDKPREFEIRQLVELFRQALIVIGPLAERAGINWLQEPPYDDWEAAAHGLFQSFVISALENSNIASQIGMFTRYGFQPENSDAYLGIRIEDKEFSFLRFAGEDRDVATVVLLTMADATREFHSWSECALFLRLPNGTHITQIEVTQ